MARSEPDKENSIERWLQALGLERYVASFVASDIGIDILTDLTDVDLEKLGVTLGDRKRLLRAIAKLTDSSEKQKAPESPKTPEVVRVSQVERRQLTAMFCDLVGSTELSARLDPEDLRQVMLRYQDACEGVLGRWNGHVGKFLGDGVLAYFGYPLVREDDAERAVRAALELIAAIGALTTEDGNTLRARIGIASGLVVAGDLIGEGAAKEESVVGETLNLAARLQALAEPGTIVVAGSTRRLITGFFELDHLGAHRLKGFAEPIDAWCVAGESPKTSRFDALRGDRLTPLIGREHELQVLSTALIQTASGDGSIVATVGEAGVGKSRLLRAFLRTPLASDRRVFSCGCRPHDSNTPWLPVVELVRSVLGMADRDDQQTALASVRHAVARFGEALQASEPALLALLGLPIDDQGWPAYSAPQRRRRILDAVKGLLQLESGRSPLILVFEDLHWADSETLALLDSLAGSLVASRLLVLVSYRPEFQHGWGGRASFSRLRIDPLSCERASELLEALLGDSKDLAKLKRNLIERTQGNPLFLEEAVHFLVEAGTLRGEPGLRELSGDPDALALPATVQAILAARIDRLSPPARQLLQRAAVIGQDVPLPVLEVVADQPSEEVRDHLAELQAAEMVFEVQVLPDLVYSFKHALTHEVAYQSLLRRSRRALHRRVGEAIEMIYAERTSELAEALTDHFEQGELWAKAARYALDSSEKAKSRYAYDTGIGFARRARAAAAKQSELKQERIWANVLLGDLASLIDALELANDSYERALVQSQDAAERLWIANKRHELHFISRNGAKIAYYIHGGGGDPLLFVSPIGYGLLSWQPILERLCQEYRIVTIDLRGTGRSDPIVRPYTEVDHALDIAAVVRACGFQPLTGIGISAAANMLIRAAADDPTLFKRFVFVGPTSGLSLLPGQAPMREEEDIVEAFVQGNLERAFRLFTPTLISEPGTEELIEQRVQGYLRLPKETALSFFVDPAPPEDEIVKLLPSIRVAVLLMHGTADKNTPFAASRQLVKALPYAQLYPFEGRCHLPMVTATQEFCDVLRTFLNTGQVPAPRQAEIVIESTP